MSIIGHDYRFVRDCCHFVEWFHDFFEVLLGLLVKIPHFY